MLLMSLQRDHYTGSNDIGLILLTEYSVSSIKMVNVTLPIYINRHAYAFYAFAFYQSFSYLNVNYVQLMVSSR